ncbi:hypothetical protein M3Y98_00255000 [Aphelenchoides besseyi]|nr:hypothetical protein M3Y98_00255000 [Aphelenchoides besseyi]KAI6200807.1 hypothetical protein M3Y96_00773500 [Aphelenchoides besseyi]
MLNVTDEQLLKIKGLQPFVELFFSIPSLIANVYFCFKFGQLTQYHITTNVFTANLSIIHPLLSGLPARIYSVANGHYFAAFLVYTMAFISHICALVIDIKYLAIGLERRFAFQNRASYELRDGSKARSILLILFPIFCFLITTKIVIHLIYADNGMTIDEMLAGAFFLEQSPITCSIMDVLGAQCLMFGLFVRLYCAFQIHCFYSFKVFWDVDRKAKSHRWLGKTLSESFEIKQVATVVEILKPLIYAYAIMSSTCSCFLFSALYLFFFGGHNVHSLLYNVLTNFAYITIAAYNFVSTVYMVLHFEPLKRAFLKDIQNATGIEFKEVTASVAPTCVENEEREHFDFLKSAWS